MPDTPFSVHPPPFNYYHPAFRSAAAKAKARSRGHCQFCGRKAPLHAHHWCRQYPPPETTTPADLTALCILCHITVHLATLYEDAGGSPEDLCGAWSESVADHLLGEHRSGSATRVGRAVPAGRGWVSLVTGTRKPAVGEVFALYLRTTNAWQAAAVTEVLDGQPGCWRVRKRFLRPDKIRLAPTTVREVAA